MDTPFSFAVGRFLFVPVGYERDFAKWEDVVKSELNKLAAVSDLQYRSGDSFIDLDVPAVFVRDSGLDEDTVDPLQVIQPESSQLNFTLNIPQRIQKELTPFDLHFGGSKFLVTINYEFYGPVAVARCTDDRESSVRQSSAIVLVREFLKRELSALSEQNLRLVSIGPSPFHGEFTIVQDESALPEGSRWQYG